MAYYLHYTEPTLSVFFRLQVFLRTRSLTNGVSYKNYKIWNTQACSTVVHDIGEFSF